MEAGFSGQVPLPANRFRSGDVVSLTEHSGKKRRAATAKHQTDASLDGEGSGSDGAAEWRATVHRVDDFKMTVVIGSARKRGDRSAADNGDDDQDVPSDSLRYRVYVSVWRAFAVFDKNVHVHVHEHTLTQRQNGRRRELPANAASTRRGRGPGSSEHASAGPRTSRLAKADLWEYTFIRTRPSQHWPQRAAA